MSGTRARVILISSFGPIRSPARDLRACGPAQPGRGRGAEGGGGTSDRSRRRTLPDHPRTLPTMRALIAAATNTAHCPLSRAVRVWRIIDVRPPPSAPSVTTVGQSRDLRRDHT
jgi:hypothetical protein